MATFLSGMTAAMFMVAAVFFLKFWRASRNRFFGFFAAACALFAFERILSRLVSLTMEPALYEALEARGSIYLFRLAGFVCIFIAIVDRNKNGRQPHRPRLES